MQRFENPPYYITAYGLAVKRGFKGNLQEWLDSLKGEKGDKVELRYLDNKIQWRWIQNLVASATESGDTAISETVETVKIEPVTENLADDAWYDLVTLEDIRGEIFEQNLEDYRKDVVLFTLQTLSAPQQAQARANIQALKVPTVKEVASEQFLYADWETFSADDDLMVYKQTGKLDWMKEPENFDFQLSFALNGTSYDLKKSDCVLSGMSISGEGKMWEFQYRPNGMTRFTTIIVANGLNPVTRNEEDSFGIAYLAVYEDYECSLTKITTTERELNVVTSVNGVEADESGNVSTENGIVLKDKTTGKMYKLYVSDGKLTMEESEV